MADYVDRGLRKFGISISKPVLATVCIVFGIMVILFPSLLVWIVGSFLVIQGALLLADYEQERTIATATTAKSVHCYNCGERNTEEATYCKKCGKRLEQPKQVTPAQPQEVAQQIAS